MDEKFLCVLHPFTTTIVIDAPRLYTNTMKLLNCTKDINILVDRALIFEMFY